eukprot:GHRQ01024793.1.p1 GENE.GHRQ01024793.1~~GHRQ01024793.1.p1  ORF type:complete len:116 (+),score=12.77 GHRQ01024793.1:435-782(+)
MCVTKMATHLHVLVPRSCQLRPWYHYLLVPMMQLSHCVFWMPSSSWIIQRVEATDCAKQHVTCKVRDTRRHSNRFNDGHADNGFMTQVTAQQLLLTAKSKATRKCTANSAYPLHT